MAESRPPPCSVAPAPASPFLPLEAGMVVVVALVVFALAAVVAAEEAEAGESLSPSLLVRMASKESQRSCSVASARIDVPT